jgi:metallo-beta-lactamase class B
VQPLSDGQTFHVGPLAVTAHVTGGHTPGGTTWTWSSCEAGRCVAIVYADSLSAISAESYRYLDHPALLDEFAHAFSVLEHLPCDILLTPHPSASRFWERVGARKLIDRDACTRYVAQAKADLETRLASERAAQQ